MPLSLKDPEADRLAREIADRTGETLTGAIVIALRERLARLRARPARKLALIREMEEIGRRCAALPTVDNSSEDEILGYDEDGIPR
ncbi:MAG: type II toxin-antitoxin system VapB family antitoxin [Cyanobacteria bacterium]|nr:type II toxin-antitoxin system VapB family antitoxin [Cyanobacteriota bacterium]